MNIQDVGRWWAESKRLQAGRLRNYSAGTATGSVVATWGEECDARNPPGRPKGATYGCDPSTTRSHLVRLGFAKRTQLSYRRGPRLGACMAMGYDGCGRFCVWVRFRGGWTATRSTHPLVPSAEGSALPVRWQPGRLPYKLDGKRGARPTKPAWRCVA